MRNKIAEAVAHLIRGPRVEVSVGAGSRSVTPASGLSALTVSTLLTASIAVAGLCYADPAAATIKSYQINPQPISTALKEFATQSELQLIFTESDVGTTQTAGVQGELAPTEALSRILKGTNLEYEITASNVVVVRKIGAVEKTSRTGNNKSPLRLAQSESSAPTNEPGDTHRDSSRNEVKPIDEVVVTAQKRTERLIEVPISISVLNGSTIKERGIEDFTDLSLAVSNLKIWDVGGAGNRGIFIRGVGNVRGTGSVVGMYIDEAAITGGPLTQMDVGLYDLEQVEVLRGPQGTLYGDGSMGGTVRFISRDPELDRFGWKGEVTSSYMEDGDSTQRVKAAINIPVVEGRFALRIASTYDDVGGWMDQPAMSRNNINDRQLLNTRIKGLWQPVDALRVKGMAILYRADTGALNHGEDEDGNYVQPFGSPLRPTTQSDYDLYNLTADYDFAGVRLTTTTTYVDQFLQTRARALLAPTFGAPPVPRLGILYGVPRANETSNRIVTHETRLGSRGGGPLDWTFGVFYRDFDGASQGSVSLGLENATPSVVPIDVSSGSKSWAVFGDANYALTERLKLGAGLRYYEDSSESSNLLTASTQSDKFYAANPKFSASYSVSDEIKTYASAARGFRSGGFNAGGLGAGRPPYEPESIWTYELGTKMAFPSQRLNAELAIFYSDYRSLQMDTFNLVNGQLVQFTTNSGTAEIKGVDLSVSWYPTEHVSLGANGTKIDATMKKVNPLGSNLNVGDPIDLIPEYDFALWAKYDYDWSDAVPGYLRVDYNQKGRSHFTNRTVGPWYHSSSDVTNMLNVLVGLERRPWTVEIFAKNLLDDRGYVDADVIETFASRAAPRSIGVRFSLDFE